MDLSAAIDAHTQWRVKLKAAISRGATLDASTITQDTQCQLGRWLNGAGRSQFGTRPEFRKLVASHSAFHAAAGKVASAVNAGRTADAEALLNGPFQTQSQDTVAAIQACKKACMSATAPAGAKPTGPGGANCGPIAARGSPSAAREIRGGRPVQCARQAPGEADGPSRSTTPILRARRARRDALRA